MSGRRHLQRLCVVMFAIFHAWGTVREKVGSGVAEAEIFRNIQDIAAYINKSRALFSTKLIATFLLP